MKRLTSLIFIFIVGGVGGIFFDRFAIPYLASTRLGLKIPALRRTNDRTTIINKTEVLRIEESGAIPDLAEKVKNAILPIEIEVKPKTKSRTATSTMELATGLVLTSDGYILLHADVASTTQVTLREGDGRIALEWAGSNTSAKFTLLYAPERRFTALPFAEDLPRLGSRLFSLSIQELGDHVTAAFQASMLSSIANEMFTVSEPMKEDSVLVNFEGQVVGVSVEERDGGHTVIPAAELRRISDELLRKKS